MSPRRWKLVEGYDANIGGPPDVEAAPVLVDEEVAVREDIITEQDVDAVAIRLATWGRGTYVGQNAREARELLSLVLGSDKEGEDAV